MVAAEGFQGVHGKPCGNFPRRSAAHAIRYDKKPFFRKDPIHILVGLADLAGMAGRTSFQPERDWQELMGPVRFGFDRGWHLGLGQGFLPARQNPRSSGGIEARVKRGFV